MAQSFSAALRRAARRMRSAKLTKATRSAQKAMAGQLVRAALAPLTAMTPKTKRPRKRAAPKAGQSLGAALARLLVPGAIPAPAAKGLPRIPKGAQYLTRNHRHTAGSRDYRLYIPGRPVKGLILMLHGCGQTPDDFAIGTHMNTLAERHGLAIAYPGQTTGHNKAACWNWFKPGHQARGSGEPAILASLARKLAGEFGLKRDAVFVAGLSAGGAMAVILSQVYPDVFAAAGVHSGLARGAAKGVVSAMSAMRKGSGSAAPGSAVAANPMRWIVFQGDSDSTVHPSNAAQIVTQALGPTATPDKTTTRSLRGRGYVRSDFADGDGRVRLELWMLQGGGHAWSGGREAGTYTDSRGPDASAQMVRFFLAKPV